MQADTTTPPGQTEPGDRSGEGADSIWEHLERDKNRKTPHLPLPTRSPTPAPRRDPPAKDA